MNTERRRRLYDLHAWVGIVSALFIFFVGFTGTVSLFNDELTTWEDRHTRIPLTANPVPIQSKLDAHMDKLAREGSFPLTVFSFPTRYKPYYESLTPYRFGQQGASRDVVARWSPVDGVEIPVRGNTFSDWMANLHINLWSPPIIGRSIVGFAGLLLFLSIVVGVFLHRKPLAALFVWRPNRGKKLFLRDSHNVLGLWGLLFHAVIAFTGIMLGLNSLMGIVFGTLAFEGDHHPHLEPYPSSQGAPSGIYAKPLSVDRARQITLATTNTEPAIVVQFNWGQTNALYRIYYEVEKPMVRYGVLDLDGQTGAIVNHYPTPPGPVSRVFASVLPLHQATYAGTWLKFVYGVLGVALCLLTVSGIAMWLERREKESLPAEASAWATHTIMSRLTIGLCAGLPLATMAGLYADQLLTFSAETRDSGIGAALFSVWAASVIFAFYWPSERQSCRLMLGSCGALALAAPLVNGISQGGFPFQFGTDSMLPTAITNLVFLIMGTIMLYISRRLPSQKSRIERQLDQAPLEPAR